MPRLFNVKADPSFCKHRAFRASVYFLMLIALAMISLNPNIIMLSALFVSVVLFVVDTFEDATDYTSIALTVCKNE